MGFDPPFSCLSLNNTHYMDSYNMALITLYNRSPF